MFSISLDKCNVKGNEEAAQAIVDRLNGLIGDLGRNCPQSLNEVEQMVYDLSLDLRKMVLELHALDQASVKETEPVSCPKCKKECRPLRLRERKINTRCGVVCVPRWEYQCDEKHYHRPWDTKHKLKGKFTHAVAEMMCRFAANFDYRAAAEELGRLGVEVSHTTLHNKVREWTKDLRALDQVECQTLEPNAHWTVSTDGCHTNSPEGWKETKVCTVYRSYPHLGSNSSAKARRESMRYTASRQNAEQCGKDLYALATHSGIYQKDIMNQKIVFIGDGAKWIWSIADEHFPNAVQIVDIMHAKSHLYDVAKVAFGEASTEKIQEWIEKVEPLLEDGNITEVVAHIRKLSTPEPEAAKVLEREANYFKNHANRMQYKAFREKGYQIGSGVIESACKHVVAQRCRRASMRWTNEGLQSILELRCMQKNNSWEKYWYPDQKIGGVSSIDTRSAVDFSSIDTISA